MVLEVRILVSFGEEGWKCDGLRREEAAGGPINILLPDSGSSYIEAFSVYQLIALSLFVPFSKSITYFRR